MVALGRVAGRVVGPGHSLVARRKVPVGPAVLEHTAQRPVGALQGEVRQSEQARHMGDLPVADNSLLLAVSHVPEVARGEGRLEHLVVLGGRPVLGLDQLPCPVKGLDRLPPDRL